LPFPTEDVLAGTMKTLLRTISKGNVGLVLAAVILGLAAHSLVLNAPFKTLDDNASIINNADIKDPANAGRIFRSSFFGGKHYYRPLVSLSFMAEYHFFGLQPFYYNLTNLALHLSIAVTVFFLAFLILKDRGAAFFAALLFAVHPVQSDAVANIAGRSVILSTFFTVNALFFYSLASGRRFFLLYALSLICFACGLLAKESAAMLPALLLAYIILFEKKGKKWPLILPYALIILAYIALRRSLGILETYPWRSPSEHVFGFLTFLRACLTYLRLLIWPSGLHFDRAQEMFLTFSDPGLIATILAFAAAGIALFKLRKHFSRDGLFFAAWFGIELFPVSQVVTTIGVGPGYISAAEHFLYMPAIGMFALMALGGQKLYRLNQTKGFFSTNTFRIVVASIFLSLMLVTVFQTVVARTALGMFKRTLAYNPNNARILFSAGIEMVNRNRFHEAEHYFLRAFAREPENISYRIALGRALCDQGKFAEGIAVYETIKDGGKWSELLKKNLDEAYREVDGKW